MEELLKKVKWGKITMGLKTHKRTYGDLKTVQHIFRLGKLEVFSCGKANSTHWFKLFGKGLSMTDKPLFSIRNGYRKTLKIGKYHIYTI